MFSLHLPDQKKYETAQILANLNPINPRTFQESSHRKSNSPKNEVQRTKNTNLLSEYPHQSPPSNCHYPNDFPIELPPIRHNTSKGLQKLDPIRTLYPLQHTPLNSFSPQEHTSAFELVMPQRFKKPESSEDENVAKEENQNEEFLSSPDRIALGKRDSYSEVQTQHNYYTHHTYLNYNSPEDEDHNEDSDIADKDELKENSLYKNRFTNRGSLRKKKNNTVHEKPRWSNSMKNALFHAIIHQKELADMSTFNWAVIGKKIGRSGKACKDQWRRAILPKLQKIYEQPDQSDSNE